MKYFLGREGVAFGPYTEFQVRESVRLGIFEDADLALPESGTEWSTIAQLLRPRLESSIPPPDRELQEAPERPEPAPPAKHPSGRLGGAKRWLALAAAFVAALSCALGIRLVLHRSTPSRHEPHRAAAVLPSARGPAAASVASRLAAAEPLFTAPPTDLAAEPDEPDASVPAPAESSPIAAPRRLIEGQIFIAARNGVRYQPSFIEVRLYSLAQIKPHLEKRAREANTKFDELKARILVAETEKEALRKAADKAFDAYIQGTPENRPALEQAVADSKKAREKATNDYYNLLQDREDLLSGAFYLEELPPSVNVTRTDGQGRFTFEVPADGQFAVVAGAQRETDEAAERYYWFVPVNIDGEPRKTVLLSNNNVSSQGSADSLVQTAD